MIGFPESNILTRFDYFFVTRRILILTCFLASLAASVWSLLLSEKLETAGDLLFVMVVVPVVVVVVAVVVGKVCKVKK